MFPSMLPEATLSLAFPIRGRDHWPESRCFQPQRRPSVGFGYTSRVHSQCQYYLSASVSLSLVTLTKKAQEGSLESAITKASLPTN